MPEVFWAEAIRGVVLDARELGGQRVGSVLVCPGAVLESPAGLLGLLAWWSPSGLLVVSWCGGLLVVSCRRGRPGRSARRGWSLVPLWYWWSRGGLLCSLGVSWCSLGALLASRWSPGGGTNAGETQMATSCDLCFTSRANHRPAVATSRSSWQVSSMVFHCLGISAGTTWSPNSQQYGFPCS